VEWAYSRKEDGALLATQPGAYKIRSQDLGKKYYDTGTFCFFGATHILGDKQAVPDRDYSSYELARSKAVDIDDYDDLAFAKALYTARRDAVAPAP
jgi:CMP-N-acetylneuraminic acid synthetase